MDGEKLVCGGSSHPPVLALLVLAGERKQFIASLDAFAPLRGEHTGSHHTSLH